MAMVTRPSAGIGPTAAPLPARRVDLPGGRPLGRSGLRTWLYEGAPRQVIHHLDRPSNAEVPPTAVTPPPPRRRGHGDAS